MYWLFFLHVFIIPGQTQSWRIIQSFSVAGTRALIRKTDRGSNKVNVRFKICISELEKEVIAVHLTVIFIVD